MRKPIECEFECPHCESCFVLNEDGIHVDDVEDECQSQCSECGGYYQLRCVFVDVFMEAIPVTKNVDAHKEI